MQDKTAGSVIRWFRRVTGFSIQLVYSDKFLREDCRLGSLDYSKDGLVALWAVLQHPKTNTTSPQRLQAVTTTLQSQSTFVLPAKLSVQDHSLAAESAKSSPNSERKTRFKYPEAFPAPPGVVDTAWNKIYTAANARMYYKAGNSVAIAKTHRTSGETYQLALTMLAEKQGRLTWHNKSPPGGKYKSHQDNAPPAPSFQADALDVSKVQVIAAATPGLGMENLPHSEVADETAIKEWKVNPKTFIQQQASAILKPGATHAKIVASEVSTSGEIVRMLAKEASMNSSLKELVKRVASSIASEDEQLQLQERYDFLASTIKSQSNIPSGSDYTYSQGNSEEPVRVICFIGNHVRA